MKKIAPLLFLFSSPAFAQSKDAVTLELGGGLTVPTCTFIADWQDCRSAVRARTAVRLSTDIASPNGGGLGLGVEYRQHLNGYSGTVAPGFPHEFALTARGYNLHPRDNGSFVSAGINLDLIRFGAGALAAVDFFRCSGNCDGLEGMGVVLIPIAAPIVGLASGLGAELGTGYRTQGFSAGAYLSADIHFIGAEVRASYSMAQ